MASCIQGPAALLPTQLSAKVPGKAVEEVPGTWAPVPNVGDPDAVPGFWIWPGSDVALVAVWGQSQWMEDPSLPLSAFQNQPIFKNLRGFRRVPSLSVPVSHLIAWGIHCSTCLSAVPVKGRSEHSLPFCSDTVPAFTPPPLWDSLTSWYQQGC